MIDETIQSGEYALQPTTDGGCFFHGPCVHYFFADVKHNAAGGEGWHLWDSRKNSFLHVDHNVPDEIADVLEQLCDET